MTWRWSVVHQTTQRKILSPWRPCARRRILESTRSRCLARIFTTGQPSWDGTRRTETTLFWSAAVSIARPTAIDVFVSALVSREQAGGSRKWKASTLELSAQLFIYQTPTDQARTCAVAGCTKKSWPMDRSGLMEDPKTRNMVERIAKGIGASQMSLANNSSGAVDLYDDFDDV